MGSDPPVTRQPSVTSVWPSPRPRSYWHTAAFRQRGGEGVLAWLSGLPAGLRSSHGRSAGSSLGSPRPPDAHAHVTGLGTWSHAGPSALMRPAQRCSSGSLSVPITDGSERLEGKVRGHLPSSHDHPQQASGLGGGKKRRKRKKKPKGNELEFIDLRCVSNKRTRCSVQGRGGTVPCPPQVASPALL